MSKGDEVQIDNGTVMHADTGVSERKVTQHEQAADQEQRAYST